VPPLAGLATTHPYNVLEFGAQKRASNCVWILEVTVVPKTAPASAPAQSKIFAKPAYLFPKPQRNLIAAVAMNVYVECLPLQVERCLCKGRPNPDESRLFRARTYRRCDL